MIISVKKINFLFFVFLCLFFIDTSINNDVFALENENVIVATEFEDMDFSMFSNRGGTAILSVSDKVSYSGKYSFLISNRKETWNGPQILLSGLLEPDTEYIINMKVKNQTSTNITIGYKYNYGTGQTYYSELGSYVGDDWQKIENLKFSFTNEMKDVHIYIASDILENIYIDDFSIIKTHIQEDIPSLKQVYSSYFRIGTEYGLHRFATNTVKDLIVKHFDSVTIPLIFPDKELSLSTGTFDNPQIDMSDMIDILEFCDENNISVKFGAFAWHDRYPEWFFREEYDESKSWVSKELMLVRLENYIKNIFEFFKTEYPNLDIHAIDVANEAWLDTGNYRSYCKNSVEDVVNGLACSIWTTIFGDNSFIEHAFIFTRKYAPATTKLYYNDFNTYIPEKRDAIYNMALELKEKNLIDGIGMQSHLKYNFENENDYKNFLFLYEEAIKKYISTGLIVQTTELDISCTDLNIQTEFYNDILDILVKYHKNISSVIFWGTTDDKSWLRENTPLLFNADYSAKEAFYAITDGLISVDLGKFNVISNIIKNIMPGVSYKELINNIITNDNFIIYKLFDYDMNYKENNDLVATGDKLLLITSDGVEKEYQLSVSGDINADGFVDIYDIIALRKHILNISKIKEAIFQHSADMLEDSVLDIYDIIALRKLILGK